MLLTEAGLSFESLAAHVDEAAISQALQEVGAGPRSIADALAEAKAIKLSRKFPDALVIGSDQILQAPGGELLDKAESREAAEVQIAKLAGRAHRLISAAVICEGGKPVWRKVETARLTMKKLTSDDIISYVDKYWEEIRDCVGCYRIEAEGRELFEEIEGARSTIIGMPLEALLDYLTLRGYERTL